jgi:hypothetical protein
MEYIYGFLVRRNNRTQNFQKLKVEEFVTNGANETNVATFSFKSYSALLLDGTKSYCIFEYPRTRRPQSMSPFVMKMRVKSIDLINEPCFRCWPFLPYTLRCLPYHPISYHHPLDFFPTDHPLPAFLTNFVAA